MTDFRTLRFEGLAELAQHFPDDDWYEIRVRIRKMPGLTAEVYVCDDIENVDTGDTISIEMLNLPRNHGTG